MHETFMSQTYSADLRKRVLVAYEQQEGSQVAIAHRFRFDTALLGRNSVGERRRTGRVRRIPWRA